VPPLVGVLTCSVPAAWTVVEVEVVEALAAAGDPMVVLVLVTFTVPAA